MAADWFDIGTRWRERHAGLDHGDLVSATAEFAAQEGLYPSTLRSFKAAVDFILRLRRQDLISERDVETLTARQFKSITVLQRISKYGTEELMPVLNLLLSNQPPHRANVERIERDIRRRMSATAGSKQMNAHAFRLRATPFKTAALAAWRSAAVSEGRLFASPSKAALTAPILVDAVSREGDSYAGLRLVAEAAKEAHIRPRLDEALSHALAASRVFKTLTLVVQSPEDAQKLAALAQRLGRSGVGISTLDDAGCLDVLLRAERRDEPDLGRAFASTLAALFR